MCLAVPGKVVEIVQSDDADDLTGRSGLIDFQGNQIQASLAMTPEAEIGSYVLVHAGFAIATMDEDEARETFEAIRDACGDIPLPTPDQQG